MRWLRGLRPIVRVELRQLMRHRGRTLLVMLLVAVPVAAMVGAGSIHRTLQASAEDRRVEAMGGASLRVDLADLSSDAVASFGRDLRDRLAGRFDVMSLATSRVDVRVPGCRLAARHFAVDPDALAEDGIAAGMLRIVEGRAPRAPDEVALSPTLLRGLRIAVGQSVGVSTGEEKRVTGVVVAPESIDLPVVLTSRELSSDASLRSFLIGRQTLKERDSVEEASLLEALAIELRAAGHRVTSRTDFAEPDQFGDMATFVVGGFGFFEAALVIAAAFAVSLRRRQREIGLLGATGAAIGGLRASQIVSAGTLAMIGGCVGVVVGVGVAIASGPFLDEWSRRLNGAVMISRVHLIGGLVLGVVTAVAAVAIPSWGATRIPVRIALSGRRPAAGTSRGWWIAGLSMFGAGIGLVALGSATSDELGAGVAVLAGSSLGVLGFGAASPWVLGQLGRVSGGLPLAWRLAVRDAGRFRVRNGPVVTAVLAGMSVSLMLAAVTRSLTESIHELRTLREDHLWISGPGAEEAARRIADEGETVAACRVGAVYRGGVLAQVRTDGRDEAARAHAHWIACGDEALLDTLDLNSAIDDFRAGKLLVLHPPGENSSAAVAQSSVSSVAIGSRNPIDLPAVAVCMSAPLAEPRYLIREASLDVAGLVAGPPPGLALMPWWVRTTDTVSTARLHRAQRFAAQYPATYVDAERLRRTPRPVVLDVVLWVCLLTGLTIILIATALSAVESTSDARVLRNVGAEPALLRNHAAARAGYLALLGCAMAVPAGMIPAVGILSLASISSRFVVPWPEVGITLFVLPTLAYGLTWLFAALRPKVVLS